jgi:hypothetical protein
VWELGLAAAAGACIAPPPLGEPPPYECEGDGDDEWNEGDEPPPLKLPPPPPKWDPPLDVPAEYPPYDGDEWYVGPEDGNDCEPPYVGEARPADDEG